MAPRKKREIKSVEVDTTINDADIDLLAAIKDETEKNGFIYIDEANLAALRPAGLVETSNARDGRGYIATRITDNGKEFLMAKKVPVIDNTKPASAFEVGSFDMNFVKPKAKSARRGRESTYKLHELATGQFLFVHPTEKHPTADDLLKSLSGTIQAANRKFAVETGEMKVVARKPKGGTEKVEKQVAVTRQDREFKGYIYTFNGVEGVALVRTA